MEQPRLGELLDAVAGDGGVLSGGPATALVVSLAAGVLEASARASLEEWKEAPGAVAQARALLSRAAHLAEADAGAYRRARELLDQVRRGESPVPDEELGAALRQAAEIPLAIGETAADVAELGATIAGEGDDDVRADALCAALVAAAASRAAAELIRVNLAIAGEHELLARADQLAGLAAQASERALDAG